MFVNLGAVGGDPALEYIHLITQLADTAAAPPDGFKTVRQWFKGPGRQILEVRLNKGAILTRHKAAVPITVLCYAGSGSFFAGPTLESSMELVPGTLITVEAGVEHEIIAKDCLHLVVSQFTGNGPQ